MGLYLNIVFFNLLKYIFYYLLLFASVASCRSKSKEPQIIESKAINSDSILLDLESECVIDEFYPSQDSVYPLSILAVGDYEQYSIPFNMDKESWYALSKKDDTYYLNRTSVFFQKSDSIEEGVDDSWARWNISCTNQDSVILLIQGLTIKENNTVSVIEIGVEVIQPQEVVTFCFKDNEYRLIGMGMGAESQPIGDALTSQGYELYIEGYKNHVLVKQRLASASFVDDTIFRILFVADIDFDGLPDFIIDTSYKYSFSQPTLYLSSFAKERELVQPVALMTNYSC